MAKGDRMGRILAVALLAVAGCDTPERRATVDACAVEWNSRLPPLYEIRTATRHRLEDVPDGTETCTTEVVHDQSDPLRSIFTTRRTCAPNTKLVSVPYQDHEEVDVRADERDVRIRDCAARRCLASHGNVSCESDG